MTPDDIARQLWTHVKRDGTMISWHQEDEGAVQTKAEAIAMVQRTLDFWAIKMIDDLQTQNGMTPQAASQTTRDAMRRNIHDMGEFAVRWGFTVDDFTFP